MANRRRLATLEELKQRKTLKFTYRDEGISREAFLAWHQNQVLCYQNVCRHIPILLDCGDGRLFNAEGTHFVCHNHGATYEPLTGKCIAGPCVGVSLKRLEIELIGEEIWFQEPG